MQIGPSDQVLVHLIGIAEQRLVDKANLTAGAAVGAAAQSPEHPAVVVDDLFLLTIHQTEAVEPGRGNNGTDLHAPLGHLRQQRGNLVQQNQPITRDEQLLLTGGQELFQQFLLVEVEVVNTKLVHSLQQLVLFAVLELDIHIGNQTENRGQQ